jgi:aldose 1-epimerase
MPRPIAKYSLSGPAGYTGDGTPMMRTTGSLLCLSTLIGLFAFSPTTQGQAMDTEFGKTSDGSPVHLFTLANKIGASVQIMNYGAIVVSLKMPDRDGKLDDIVLGFDDLPSYIRSSPYFGAIVGRYGNRIGGAAFTLDGVLYKLDANERGNILHGGHHGFDRALWTVAKVDNHSIELTYMSKDGEAGFPGNLTARVHYTLTDANELKIEYTATTDRDTVVNLTHHSYFNLAGQGQRSILDHELTINADQFTPVNSQLIPTGELFPVDGTPFDFRQPHRIGERIDAHDPQLRFAGGYDHNWVLKPHSDLALAASVYEPTTGRVMEVWTTEPGLQFYSGNGLSGVLGKAGQVYRRHSALCLETQHYPDSPNQPQFPTTVLKPGQTYQTTTLYRFTSRPK